MSFEVHKKQVYSQRANLIRQRKEAYVCKSLFEKAAFLKFGSRRAHRVEIAETGEYDMDG